MSDERPTPKTKRARRNYSDEFKDSAVKLVARGELSISRGARDLGVSDSLLRLWVDKARAAESGGLSSEERIELARLRKEVRILKEEREIPKKDGDLLRQGEPVVSRCRFIEDHSVVILCRVLQVARAAFYDWRRVRDQPQEQDALSSKIHVLFDENHGRYGSRRLHKELAESGTKVSRSTVVPRLKTLNLCARPMRNFTVTTDSNRSAPVAENLLNREFTADAPNRRWVGDITCIWTAEGWLYLATLIDLYSRKVVGYSMSQHIDRQLVLGA